MVPFAFDQKFSTHVFTNQKNCFDETNVFRQFSESFVWVGPQKNTCGSGFISQKKLGSVGRKKFFEYFFMFFSIISVTTDTILAAAHNQPEK